MNCHFPSQILVIVHSRLSMTGKWTTSGQSNRSVYTYTATRHWIKMSVRVPCEFPELYFAATFHNSVPDKARTCVSDVFTPLEAQLPQARQTSQCFQPAAIHPCAIQSQLLQSCQCVGQRCQSSICDLRWWVWCHEWGLIGDAQIREISSACNSLQCMTWKGAGENLNALDPFFSPEVSRKVQVGYYMFEPF